MNSKYQEEYISAKQAAWFMQINYDMLRSYLNQGRLLGIKKRKTEDTLVEVSSIEQDFYKRVNKYKYATDYFRTDDKNYFWSLAPVQFSRKSDVEGYLSITQVALLIGRGRQGVQYLIDTGYLETTKKQRKTYEQSLISEVSLKKFVDDELEQIHKRYRHLIDYINSDNKEKFWNDNQLSLQEYHKDLVQKRREENRAMWIRRRQRENGEIQ